MRLALLFLSSVPIVMVGCTSATVVCEEGSSSPLCRGLTPVDAAVDVGDSGVDAAMDASVDTRNDTGNDASFRDAFPDISIESGPDTDGMVEEGPDEPTPEDACDSRDNDGDGRTDEGFVLGAACSITQNGCVGTGAIECDRADTSMTRCGGELGTPEICNGVDDDCDAVIDETFPVGEACAVMEDGCTTTGIQQCISEVETACIAMGDPTGPDEVCNAVDDDCDGRIDEGFAIGESCTSGECIGVRACGEDGRTECQTVGVPESCDGEDNDCDGIVDEDATGRCDSPGCETDGTAICEDARLVCAGGGPAEASDCDAMDTNCDGFLDERPDEVACESDSDRPECYPFQRAGSQYLFCFSSDWDGARRHCERLGYRLTRINSEEENDALRDIINPIPGVDRMWLGARATDFGPSMAWLDGTRVSDGYRNYRSGEPNGFAQCLRMEFRSWTAGEWGDRGCGTVLPFVCEYIAP